jgi:hypothetical protein
MQSGIVPFSAKSKVTGGDKNIAVHYSENENCLSTERANAAVPHRGFSSRVWTQLLDHTCKTANYPTLNLRR